MRLRQIQRTKPKRTDNRVALDLRTPSGRGLPY